MRDICDAASATVDTASTTGMWLYEEAYAYHLNFKLCWSTDRRRESSEHQGHHEVVEGTDDEAL